MPEFPGVVTATQIISLRFSEGGRLAWIKCGPGNLVKKGQALAGLDPKPIQTQLDIELADYRRIRAEFDQLSRKIPEPKNEDEKTQKEISQSRLEVSVKTVERYKLQLDALTLVAPLDAVVLETESLVPGVNLTPSGFPITLAALDSTVFEVKLPEEKFYRLSPGQKGKVTFKTGSTFETEIVYLSPQNDSKGNFTAHFKLPPMDLANFRLGITGKVTT